MPRPNAQSVARAFTLVEVLCCCAVVALLMGMLLPALAGARSAAKAAACAVSLRQLTTGNDAYSVDNRGSYAPASPDSLANRTRWFGARASLTQAFDSEGGPLSDYLGGTGGQAARRCPGFSPATGPLAFERGCGGYGYNKSYVGVRLRKVGSAWQIDTDRCGAAASSFDTPAATVAFADAAAFVGAQSGVIEYSFAEPRWWPGQPDQRPDPSVHFRHGARKGVMPGEANAAWLDGHVSPQRRTFTAFSGVYGTPLDDPLLGWFGDNDDNALFGARQ